jgi:hypothetical protein
MDGAKAESLNQQLQLDSIPQHENGREILMRARKNLRQCVWVLAAVLSTGVVGGSVWAAASSSSQDQAHDQDYSKNKNYQVGARDGKDDKAHNRDHSRKRKFKKDEDQKAYEAGYQQARR